MQIDGYSLDAQSPKAKRKKSLDKLYSVMDDQEKRQFMESLLSEVQIYAERQPNGQWLKSIKFKLPIIAEDMNLSLDNDAHIESMTNR